MAAMTIGKVARAAGVGVETVRFYERTGLMTPPPRTRAGYRQYPPEAVDRLAFIRHAQRLGFTLTEVAELIALHETPAPCEDVKARAVAKVAAIEEKIATLQAVKDELVALVARCETACTTSCPVLTVPTSSGGEERMHP